MNWLAQWLSQHEGAKPSSVSVRPLQESAGAAYAVLIAEQLAEERLRARSLEQRGVTVITTSGVIVGFLFGLVAVFTKSTSYVIPHRATAWVAAAMVSFTISATFGVGANVPLNYSEPVDEALKGLVVLDDGSLATTRWQSDPYVAALRVAEVRVKMITGARTKNNWKARLLLIAQFSEVLAIVLLVIALSYVVPK